MSMRNVITLRDQMSTAFVYESFDLSRGRIKLWSSGAAKAGVPARVCSAVSPSVARLLIPKSAILIHQSGPLYTTNMFCVGYNISLWC